MLYKANETKILLYVIIFDCIMTNYYKKYLQQLNISLNIEAYIQSRILKKTLETIFFKQLKSIDDDLKKKNIIICAIKNLIKLAQQEV